MYSGRYAALEALALELSDDDFVSAAELFLSLFVSSDSLAVDVAPVPFKVLLALPFLLSVT